MKERYVFLTGFGVGMIITAIIGIFIYNTEGKKIDPSQIISNPNYYDTTQETEFTTESTTSLLNLTELTTEETTSNIFKIDAPNMEITTQSFELNTEITTKTSMEIQAKELKIP